MGDTDTLVTNAIARQTLLAEGWPLGVSRFSAVKHAMGLKHHRMVSVRAIREWLVANPDFKEQNIYERKPVETAVGA